MKMSLRFFFFLCFLGTSIYFFKYPLNPNLVPVKNYLQDFYHSFFPVIPCSEPLEYTLGTFDKRFDISQSYFLNALVEAEAIWEKSYGKELFVYAPTFTSEDDTLKVNLIYDYRQEATSKLSSLGIEVKNTRASYDTLRAKFLALKKEHTLGKSTFENLLLAFNQKKGNYEKQVVYWNRLGGAPQKEFNTLQQLRIALDNEAKALTALQKSINNMVEEINALVVVLNRLADTLNLSVDKYNTVSVSRGETFEEGVYSFDGEKAEIDIYEFSSREKLVRVLAHELGHALGLDHVEDEKAIMYKLNQGKSKALTEADLLALKARCGVE